MAGKRVTDATSNNIGHSERKMVNKKNYRRQDTMIRFVLRFKNKGNKRYMRRNVLSQQGGGSQLQGNDQPAGGGGMG